MSGNIEEDLTSFDNLLQTMALLRSPQGCPWDREQTHRSLRRNLLEECHEALEAIDHNDPQALSEELGDLLIQIVFHAQIGASQGTFTIEDVIRTVSEKIRRRHPHVFGNIKVADAAEVKVNWDRIKQQERGTRSIIDGVPKDMPALAYSQAVQDRASRAGFDWEGVQGVLEKVTEELLEFFNAQSQEEREEEMGDMLFAIVNAASRMDVSVEESLRQANRKFYSRFTYMERLCRERNLTFVELPMAEKDKLWKEAKAALVR